METDKSEDIHEKKNCKVFFILLIFKMCADKILPVTFSDFMINKKHRILVWIHGTFSYEGAITIPRTCSLEHMSTQDWHCYSCGPACCGRLFRSFLLLSLARLLHWERTESTSFETLCSSAQYRMGDQQREGFLDCCYQLGMSS